MTEAHPATTAEPRWGLGDAALAFAAGVVGATAAITVYIVVAGDSSDLGVTIASLVGLWAGMAGVAVAASRRKGSGSLAHDFGLSLHGSDVGKGIAAGVGCHLLLITVVIALFELIGPPVQVDDQARNVTSDATGWRLAVLAPFIVLGAPLFEELFFRGLLLRALRRRAGTVAAIAFSSLAFGLVHVQTALDAWSTVALVAALTAFGVVLGLLAHRTGRLGASLVAHATFNAITVALLAAGT